MYPRMPSRSTARAARPDRNPEDHGAPDRARPDHSDGGADEVSGELSGSLPLVEPQRSAGIAEAVMACGLEEVEQLAHLLPRCRRTRFLTECHLRPSHTSGPWSPRPDRDHGGRRHRNTGMAICPVLECVAGPQWEMPVVHNRSTSRSRVGRTWSKSPTLKKCPLCIR